MTDVMQNPDIHELATPLPEEDLFDDWLEASIKQADDHPHDTHQMELWLGQPDTSDNFTAQAHQPQGGPLAQPGEQSPFFAAPATEQHEIGHQGQEYQDWQPDPVGSPGWPNHHPNQPCPQSGHARHMPGGMLYSDAPGNFHPAMHSGARRASSIAAENLPDWLKAKMNEINDSQISQSDICQPHAGQQGAHNLSQADGYSGALSPPPGHCEQLSNPSLNLHGHDFGVKIWGPSDSMGRPLHASSQAQYPLPAPQGHLVFCNHVWNPDGMAAKPTGFAINHHFTHMYNQLSEIDKQGPAFEQLRSHAAQMGLFPMTLAPAIFTTQTTERSVQTCVWNPQPASSDWNEASGSIDRPAGESQDAAEKEFHSPAAKSPGKQESNSAQASAHSQRMQQREALLEGQASIVGHASAEKVTSQQHSSDCGKKLTVQLTPRDEATKVAMNSANLNPALELACRSRKELSQVLQHLNRKWKAACPSKPWPEGQHALRLYPTAAMPILMGACWGPPHSLNGLTLADLHTAMGNPAVLPLHYRWDAVGAQEDQHHISKPHPLPTIDSCEESPMLCCENQHSEAVRRHNAAQPAEDFATPVGLRGRLSSQQQSLDMRGSDLGSQQSMGHRRQASQGPRLLRQPASLRPTAAPPPRRLPFHQEHNATPASYPAHGMSSCLDFDHAGQANSPFPAAPHRASVHTQEGNTQLLPNHPGSPWFDAAAGQIHNSPQMEHQPPPRTSHGRTDPTHALLSRSSNAQQLSPQMGLHPGLNPSAMQQRDLASHGSGLAGGSGGMDGPLNQQHILTDHPGSSPLAPCQGSNQIRGAAPCSDRHTAKTATTQPNTPSLAQHTAGHAKQQPSAGQATSGRGQAGKQTSSRWNKHAARVPASLGRQPAKPSQRGRPSQGPQGPDSLAQDDKENKSQSRQGGSQGGANGRAPLEQGNGQNLRGNNAQKANAAPNTVSEDCTSKPKRKYTRRPKSGQAAAKAGKNTKKRGPGKGKGKKGASEEVVNTESADELEMELEKALADDPEQNPNQATARPKKITKKQNLHSQEGKKPGRGSKGHGPKSRPKSAETEVTLSGIGDSARATGSVKLGKKRRPSGPTGATPDAKQPHNNPKEGEDEKCRASPTRKQLTFDTAPVVSLQPGTARVPLDKTCDGFDAWTAFSRQKQTVVPDSTGGPACQNEHEACQGDASLAGWSTDANAGQMLTRNDQERAPKVGNGNAAERPCGRGHQDLPSDMDSFLIPEDLTLDFEDFLNQGGFELDDGRPC